MSTAEEYRLDRVREMEDVSAYLRASVEKAVAGDDSSLLVALGDMFVEAYTRNDAFARFPNPKAAFSWFMERIQPGLDAVKATSSPERIASWLGTAVVNGAKAANAPNGQKMWLSRRDQRVRPFHVDADGQTVAWDAPFTVCDGTEMLFPGQPVGDPSCWINCRCVLADASMFTSIEEVATMTAAVPELEDEVVDDTFLEDDAESADGEEVVLGDMRWHGVLAPEGIMSGDGRSFSPGALTWRDLPLPLRHQPADTGGHDGAVVFATIDEIRRDGALLLAEGGFLETPQADEMIGRIAEQAVGGISVDVDDSELAQQDDTHVEFGKGRICAATVVDIPAFAETFIALGPLPASAEPDQDAGDEFAISEAPWDGSASRFTPEEYKRSCCLHRSDSMDKSEHSLPIKEPNGDLNRAAVHAAASRIGQVTDASPEQIASAKRELRGAYGQLDEEPPDSLTASAAEGVIAAEDYARGPGWLTHPVDTRRLHAYWTSPGHKGYTSIRWGTPGDFRRLRRALSKYIEPVYLNRVAAQWHHDALGYWPGECGKPGNPPCGASRGKHNGESVSLVAAPATGIADDLFFTNPQLDRPTPMTITDGGRIYGHLALWDTCHIGVRGVCTTPPHSHSGYAYFATGAYLTDSEVRSVGQITMGTGHAGLSDNHRAASAHYDNTGTAVADIVVGDDDCGIWYSGITRPGLTDEQVQALRAGSLSGDWRNIGGNLELVAALVVNVPGFPIPRTALAASGGQQTSLIAAGVMANQAVPADISGLVDAVEEELQRRAVNRARIHMARMAINEVRVEAVRGVIEV